MRYLDPETAELLAAEYVLGTLRGAARRRFERLLQAHPALRLRVQAWERHFSRLIETVPPVAPPSGTWGAIQQRLFPTERLPWHKRLGFWRGLSLGSGVLAAVLAGLLLLTPVSEVPGYVVMIANAAEQPLWIISTSSEMERLYVKNLKPMDMPERMRCLLWLRPKGSDEVYPLGILPDQGDERIIRVDEALRPLLPGQLLVTIEHADGTPPDRPDGAPVYEGKWMPLARI